MAWIEPGTRFFFGIGLDIHTLVYASALIFVGLQTILFALFTKVHGVNLKLLPPDPLLDRMLHSASLERGLVLGVLLLAGGVAGTVYAVSHWYNARVRAAAAAGADAPDRSRSDRADLRARRLFSRLFS